MGILDDPVLQVAAMLQKQGWRTGTRRIAMPQSKQEDRKTFYAVVADQGLISNRKSQGP
jgi:hypothetical protein